ncbi:hypothetical protein NQ317_019843 [Molorchus minor]|uniref:Uncharacterized protein n=1 Tax=Molorchus minor TaxID=1323400 RepID=A0ABQ9JAF3_9CUCU|nr:hypothetical protein NQ317_019843 [Molorchus minor]
MGIRCYAKSFTFCTSAKSNVILPHNTIGIWDAKLTYLDIPVPKIAGKMDVPFRISRDILKAIKFVVIIELIKLMSRSVNQVYTKIFKMPKEAKKRRFYRKLNGLNKNCESLIFHNKKRGLWLIICNFAKNFSWDGLKGKKAFRNLNLETVIRAATINSFMSLKIKVRSY